MRSTSTDTRILRKKLHKGGKTRLKVAGGDNHRSVHSGFSERPPASSIANGEVLSRMGRVCENWFAVCDQDIPRSKSRSNNDALLLGSIGIRRVPGSAHDESKHSTQQLLVLQLQDFNNVSKIFVAAVFVIFNGLSFVSCLFCFVLLCFAFFVLCCFVFVLVCVVLCCVCFIF